MSEEFVIVASILLGFLALSVTIVLIQRRHLAKLRAAAVVDAERLTLRKNGDPDVVIALSRPWELVVMRSAELVSVAALQDEQVHLVRRVRGTGGRHRRTGPGRRRQGAARAAGGGYPRRVTVASTSSSSSRGNGFSSTGCCVLATKARTVGVNAPPVMNTKREASSGSVP